MNEDEIQQKLRNEHLVAKYKETGRLSSPLSLVATLFAMRGSDDPRIKASVNEFNRENADTLKTVHESMERVQHAMKEWERKHWLTATGGNYQGYYRASTRMSHVGKTEKLDLLMWGTAGRVLVTLEGAKSTNLADACVTLIFDETATEARGGVQGIDATEEQALQLLAETVPLLAPHD